MRLQHLLYGTLVFVAATFCKPKVDSPLELTKSTPSQSNTGSLYAADIPRLENLIYPRPLNQTEFNDLVASVRTLDDLDLLFREYPIEYPDKETCQYDFAFANLYTAPLDTFNARFGVCDEQGMARMPFLINIKMMGELNKILLVEFRPEIEPEESEFTLHQDLPPGHTVTIFQNRWGLWGYTSNDQLVKPYAQSKERILGELNTQLGYQYVKVWEREFDDFGPWLFDSNQSVLHRPNHLVTTYSNAPRCGSYPQTSNEE